MTGSVEGKHVYHNLLPLLTWEETVKPFDLVPECRLTRQEKKNIMSIMVRLGRGNVSSFSDFALA